MREDLIGKVEVKKESDDEGKEESDDEKVSLIDEEELEMKEVEKKIDALTVSWLFIHISLLNNSSSAFLNTILY